jgi:dTDP-4-amino-4,6-dideoxygalactose transaminase
MTSPEAARDALLPLARPVLGEAEAAAVQRVLRTGWVSQGPEVAAFEAEFAAAVGAPHACAVASGTAALHLALRGVGVGPGDEVITVSHSFVATAASVRHCGALPVFVDVDPATGNLDPRCLAPAVTVATRAILCVHQLGMPCDLEAIADFAAAHGLPLVEDAACAVGSAIRWRGVWTRIGRPHGHVACFSFHGRKVLTTGEGGMVTTADPALDARLRRWRSHGVSLPADVRHAASQVAIESYPEPGFNYRLSDLQAAVGREQLRRLAAIVARRRELAARYDAALRGVAAIAPPREPAWARSNWQSYAVRLAVGLDPRQVMQRLLDAGIATRPGVTCAHREGAFPAGTWRCGGDPDGCAGEPGACRHLAASEEAQARSIQLPLFPDMHDDDPRRVVAALERACA